MSNEEKILQALEQMNERQDKAERLLEQLQQGQTELQKGQAAMQEDISEMKEDIVELKGNVAALQEDVSEIKENAEVTRSATNSLVKWADDVSVITQIKYPVAK